MLKIKQAASAALIALLASTSALAASDEDIEALRAEIQKMKQDYQSRIAAMRSKLNRVERTQPKTGAPAPATPATARRDVKNNSFNPSIGIILNGQYSQFSSRKGEISGFASGEEGERPREGFAVDHTELNFSANVDDKFFGSTTAALAHHGGAIELELEEAYIQTLPGIGLPAGMSVKAGRAFWTFGYLNEHHSHADDFADRPLPYRVFLDGAFNDDGAEASYVLPIDFYVEAGGGVFRGDDFPFGKGDGEGISAWSAFARTGGDIGNNQSWRLGGYVLSGKADGDRVSNEDEVRFTGDTDIYAVDLRYIWTPTGNARDQEVIFQGEYFWRNEDGKYAYNEEGLDSDMGTVEDNLDDSSSGWYVQAVYKFAPQWRVGARYSQIEVPDVPTNLADSPLDSGGHDPKAYSVMLDWTNSEFSRVRVQFNHETVARYQNDKQVMLQYIMSLGAHSAHKY